MVHLKNEEGQAVTEYILMMAVVVGFYYAVVQGLTSSQIGTHMLTAFSSDFAHAYQHGHPKAKGYEDGGPTLHPRAVTDSNPGANNFRIFLINQSGGNEEGSQ